MPGWHAKTRQLVKDGKLIVLGIAPEQHGDRMALFLQWKGMQDMRVLVDSYNAYRLKAVPITLLIDESGVVRFQNPKEAELAAFLALPPAGVGTAPAAPRDWQRDLAAVLGREDLDPLPPDAANLTAAEAFRRGVALRKAYDRGGINANPEHFARAIYFWRSALHKDPSNYIWRRRLQQYGPRLDKPYSFYDWVTTARRELRANGLEPHPLRAEPTGAEFAAPARQELENVEQLPHPDPDDKLSPDADEIVKCNTIVVPHTQDPLKAVRVFLTLTPNPGHKTKWNDEAGLSTVRMVPPVGWQASAAVTVLSPPQEDAIAEDHRPRQVEFELRRTADGQPSTPASFVFKLYYNVCYGENRVCQIFRKDVSVNYGLEEAPKEEPR